MIGAWLQRLLGQSLWLSLDRILRIVLALTVGAWVARYLGPHDYGTLAYLGALTGLFAPLVDLGLREIAIREMSLRPGEHGEILGSAIVLRVLGAVLAATAALGVVAMVEGDDSRMLIAIPLVLAMCISCFDAWEWPALVAGDNRAVAVVRCVLLALSAGIRIVLIWNEAPIMAFAWAAFIEAALLIVGLFAVGRLKFGVSLQSSWRVARQLIAWSWPLAISSAMVMVYMRIDMLMLEQMSNMHEVGQYAVAMRLAESWYFVPMALAAAAQAGIVRAFAVSREQFQFELLRLFRIMHLLGLGAGAALSALSPFIISVLFGAQYTDAAWPLAISAFAGWMVGLGVARSIFLTTVGRTRFHTWSVFLGAATNVLLNLFLIPEFGAVGASIATLSSYWVAAHGSCLTRAEFRPMFLLMLGIRPKPDHLDRGNP